MWKRIMPVTRLKCVEWIREKVYGARKWQIIKGNGQRGVKLIKCKRIFIVTCEGGGVCEEIRPDIWGGYKSGGLARSKPDPIILYFRFQFAGKGKQKVLKVFLMRKIHSDWPSADKLFPLSTLFPTSPHFSTLYLSCLLLSGCDTSVCII